MIDTAVRVFERAGFGEVVTPTFEDTALFARTAGDASDIVSKEMYSFTDRGGRELTLRPEGTAPVVRAYLEHGQAREPQPVKLWYVAPMFRYARAQRGRYREHWQFGVESLGSDDPAVDAEVIALQAAWYRELGLLDGLVLELNSIGDSACRPAYRALLVAYLERFRDELSADSQVRLDVNPLRIFDSKDEGDQQIVRGAPLITDHLCDACAEHFAGVRAFLDARELAYRVTPVAGARASTTTSARPGSGSSPAAAAQAGIDLGRRALRRAGGADRRQPRAGRRLRLRHRARRAGPGGRRRRRRPPPAVDWFCRLRRRGRAAAAARAARARARARALVPGRPRRPQPEGPAAARRAHAAPAWSRSAAPATPRVASSGTERPRSRSRDLVDYVERSVRNA